MEAIMSATEGASTLLQKEDELGAVAPGFVADVVAVQGDPLTTVELLEAVDFVMKDGVVYKQDGREVIGVSGRPIS